MPTDAQTEAIRQKREALLAVHDSNIQREQKRLADIESLLKQHEQLKSAVATFEAGVASFLALVEKNSTFVETSFRNMVGVDGLITRNTLGKGIADLVHRCQESEWLISKKEQIMALAGPELEKLKRQLADFERKNAAVLAEFPTS